MNEFVTKLGCTVRVVPAPEYLGDGVLLTLRMEQPGDGRYAEVYLSNDDLARLGSVVADAALKRLAGVTTTDHPTVVCLCGSTRFYEAFQDANFRETLAGRIVLSVGFYPHAQAEAHGQNVGITAEQKVALDELHKRKIDLADEVLVINVAGYVGESTEREIAYAHEHGKLVRYIHPVCVYRR